MMLHLAVIAALAYFAAAGPIEKDPKIVGGENADITTYPWQLSLRQTGGSHICGAVLISNNWALTAAHCLTPGNTYVIGYGATDKRSSSTVAVAEFIMHEGYQEAAPYPNDIAVLRLASSLSFGPTVSSIAMADSSALSSCSISGWGLTGFILGIIPIQTDILQHVFINTITNTQCSNMWTNAGGPSVPSTNICLFEQTKSACSGDSGGPLQCAQNGQAVVAGITSWGASTCSGELPSVYTRVSEYRTWISSKTGL